MDTLYRFVYSTFAMHWRNYNMVHQEGLFWEREKDCYFLLSIICTLGVGTIIYGSGTSFIRYLYVRSSLISNIQETLKRDSFIIKSLIIGESLSMFNLGKG